MSSSRWPLGEDGRKLYAGTALFSADGELLALARQTWIRAESGLTLAAEPERVQILGEDAVDPLLELVGRVVLGVEVAAGERVEAS